ncbi:MAG: hypothetical protein LAO09_10380 [Acidobacteriia bacterium]|nr:hypothetical protein [Terriglobia bacterium]
MKHIGLLLVVLCVSLVPVAGAQQAATKPVGKMWHLRHPLTNRTPRTPGVTASQSFNAEASLRHKAKIWEFGAYDGGTWAALTDINDLGMAVGYGDVPPIGPDGAGSTHTLAVPVFGPHAGEWIDLGTLGGDQPMGWEEPFPIQISNTGLVATHSTTPNGQVHAAAWTKRSGMVDLGTLADTGDPRYSNYNSSYAGATNRLGTLIVGWSGVDGAADAPVVWTPSLKWKNGELVTKWKIHKLDTAGFPDLTGWQAWAVNDFGQIVAIAFNEDESIIISALWNPRPDGKGWKLMPLPPSPDYPVTLAFHINDRGQISGAVVSADDSTWLPRFWKPLNTRRTKYTDPIELALPQGFAGCESVGLNEVGDMTGDCYNDTTSLPVRWTTKNPSFSEIISFPGDWGFCWGINNHRTAVAFYGGGENCSADNYVSCGGATQLH